MPGWRWHIKTNLACPRCGTELKKKIGYYKLLCKKCNEYYDPYDTKIKKIQ